MIDTDLIASYHGIDCKVTLVSGRQAFISTDSTPANYYHGNAASNHPMVLWVSKLSLQPAECTCDELSGIACRACRDWHALTGDGEMPF